MLELTVRSWIMIYRAAICIRQDNKSLMVGTIQTNQTDAPMGASVKGPLTIKKKVYEYKMWQHNTQSLLAAVLSDNSLVKTLSHYRGPEIVAPGMSRRKIGPDGIRE